MSNAKIQLSVNLEMLVPLLEMCQEYFDSKYPCTTENNDGSDMPISDELKYISYNYLLNAYNKNKDISIECHKEFHNRVQKQLEK